MKKLLFISLLTWFALLKISSQTFLCGTTGPAGPARTASNIPTACRSLTVANILDDLVPQASEPTLTVNVNFWCFKPYSGGGVWANNTAAHAAYCLFTINQLWSSLFTPDYSVPYAAVAPNNTNITFALKTFSVVADTGKYVFGDSAANSIYDDPNAINVYMSYSPGGRPHTAFSKIGTNDVVYCVDTAQNISSAGFALSHEFGHALGLQHPWDNIGYSYIDLEKGCCTSVYAEDTELQPEAQNSIGSLCGSQPGISNNVMSYNWACQKYFSARQMGIMHYHLRTDLQDVLIPASKPDALYRNAAFDYTITTSETWTRDKYVKGNIIINPGAKLTIGCLVAMTHGAKIMVKPQGALAIMGGTVTNISGQLWRGIEVAGSSSAGQTFYSTGFAASQGMLVTDIDAEISNAGTGCTNYATDNNNNIVWNSIGGIVQGSFTHFLNNIRDLEFLTYPNYPSASVFKFCDFKTTQALNEGQTPFAHASIWDNYSINFWGCNFEYAAGTAYAPANRGLGIFSVDANYQVNQYCESSGSTYPCPTMQRSQFRNLYRGVWVANSNILRGPAITNTNFYDNTGDGVYLHNSNAFDVSDNYFRMRDTLSNGIYLNSCQNYLVKNNTLEEYNYGQLTTGIYAYNSQNGAHQVYRNNFAGFNAALLAVDNNSGYNNPTDGLLMNCNDFTPASSMFDIAMLGDDTAANAPTVKRVQGVAFPITAVTSSKVVRNKYGAVCNNESKCYADGAGTSTLTITHGSNSDAVCKPLPQPACSNTIVNVVQVLGPMSYTDACPPYPSTHGGNGPTNPTTPGGIVSNINQHLAYLQGLGEDADPFELEATAAAKIAFYASYADSASKDSVIAILSQNPSHMANADVQLAFAYLNRRNYSMALSTANALPGSKSDWKNLLVKLVAIYQEPNQLYSVCTNGSYRPFLQSSAATKAMAGQGISQAILKFACAVNYSEPRPLPKLGSGSSRVMNTQVSANLPDGIQVYPNPTQSGITIKYNSQLKDAAQVEVKDLLGRLIYTNFIYSNETYIPLQGCNNGLYLVTVTKNKEVLYTGKIIKQD